MLEAQIEVKDNAICNPTDYYGCIYRMQSAILGIVSEKNLYEQSLLSRNLLLCSPLERSALDSFALWFYDQEMAKVNLSELYERMLCIEFPLEDGSIVQDNEIYHLAGWYYTPDKLADRMVEIALNGFIFQRLGIDRFSTCKPLAEQVRQVKELLMRSSFADLSCGTGSLFLAILRYCRTHLKADSRWLQHISLNFHAFEADGLALEIAMLRIMEAVDNEGMQASLSLKLKHGNPLIAPSTYYPTFNFYHHHYYRTDLAIEPSEMQICDVVLGNPPWANVNFPMREHAATLCPMLEELAEHDEGELELEEIKQTHPDLYNWLVTHDDATDVAIEALYSDNRFQYSVMGGLQTKALFTELSHRLCNIRGTLCMLLSHLILKDPQFQRLFGMLIEERGAMVRYDQFSDEEPFEFEDEFKLSILTFGLQKST